MPLCLPIWIRKLNKQKKIKIADRHINRMAFCDSMSIPKCFFFLCSFLNEKIAYSQQIDLPLLNVLEHKFFDFI